MEKVVERGDGVMCERLINFIVTSLGNHPVNVIHNADGGKKSIGVAGTIKFSFMADQMIKY